MLVWHVLLVNHKLPSVSIAVTVSGESSWHRMQSRHPAEHGWTAYRLELDASSDPPEELELEFGIVKVHATRIPPQPDVEIYVDNVMLEKKL